MTTTEHHEIYRDWHIYTDFDAIGQFCWIACSDRFETCVRGDNRDEVIREIDEMEDE